MVSLPVTIIHRRQLSLDSPLGLALSGLEPAVSEPSELDTSRACLAVELEELRTDFSRWIAAWCFFQKSQLFSHSTLLVHQADEGRS